LTQFIHITPFSSIQRKAFLGAYIFMPGNFIQPKFL